MSATEDGLGGRLALFDPAAVTATQRELFDRITASAVPWAQRSGFAATTAGGRLIGPFNPTLLSPEIAAKAGASGAILPVTKGTEDSVADPKAGACDTLFKITSDPRLNHRCQVVSGVLAADCAGILGEFFQAKRREGKK